MFEVGERVVCVDAEWSAEDGHARGPCPLEKGRQYEVKTIFPAGLSLSSWAKLSCDSVGVGVECQDLRRWCNAAGLYLPAYDIWEAYRFRRIQGKDIRESLSTLVGLFDTTKAPEVVDA